MFLRLQPVDLSLNYNTYIESDNHLPVLQNYMYVLSKVKAIVTPSYGRRQNKLPVSVSYSAVKTLQNGSCRRCSVFTVRA